MTVLLSEIAVSLVIAFLIGCVFAWLWRGSQLNKRVAEAERGATQRAQYEIATLRSDLESSQDEIAQQRDLLDQQAYELEQGSNAVLIAGSAEETETLKQKLANLDERYVALHTRWERERTQFAQLVAHKNQRIAELERAHRGVEEAVIEDGAAVDAEEDNSNYSRQQLESMLVDLRAQVAEQETELSSLRERTASGPDAADGDDAAALQHAALVQRDAEIARLRDALEQQGATRLAAVEQERAELLHKVSALNSQRATDAEHTASLHREVESLQSNLSDTQRQLAEHSAHSESLSAANAALRTEIEAAEQRVSTVAELESRCTQLSDDVGTLQALLDTAHAERDAARMEAMPLHGTLDQGDDATARLEALTRDNTALRGDLHRLETELAQLHRDHDGREQALRRADAELDELRPLQHQLVALRSNLGELVQRDEHGSPAQVADLEIQHLRTRIAHLQADAKLNLERKEHYYQTLLREKSARIAELERTSTALEHET